MSPAIGDPSAILGHRAAVDNIARPIPGFSRCDGKFVDFPPQPAFGREKDRPNQTLVGQFP